MPETEVETPAAPVTTEEPIKEKEILEDKKVEDEPEKKDDEKKEEESSKDDKKEKPKKEKKPKEPATPPPPPVHKKDFEKDVVYLFQFPRCATIPNISPKCLKVETWLKFHGIKYENVNHGGKLRSKKGILPFVEVNGEEIADSDIIVKNLSDKYSKQLDEDLSQEQRNIQRAMVALVEGRLHGAFLHWASKNSEDTIKGYKLDLQHFTGHKLPNGILNFWFKIQYCRKGLKKAKAAIGTNYTVEEIEEEGKKDLLVLKEMLGDKEFFFGDEPHSLDLATFCQLAQIINVQSEVKCPMREFLESECTNLVGLYNRMKDRTWGDHWDQATGDKLDLNPHIPKPDPPKEEEKKEEGDKKDNKEEEKEKGDKDEKEKEEKKEDEEEKKE